MNKVIDKQSLTIIPMRNSTQAAEDEGVQISAPMADFLANEFSGLTTPVSNDGSRGSLDLDGNFDTMTKCRITGATTIAADDDDDDDENQEDDGWKARGASSSNKLHQLLGETANDSHSDLHALDRAARAEALGPRSAATTAAQDGGASKKAAFQSLKSAALTTFASSKIEQDLSAAATAELERSDDDDNDDGNDKNDDGVSHDLSFTSEKVANDSNGALNPGRSEPSHQKLVRSAGSFEQGGRFDILAQRLWDWNLDMFDVFASTRQPLLRVGFVTLDSFSDYIPIDRFRMINFLRDIEAAYRDVPYHNHLHGATVGRSVFSMCKAPRGLAQCLSMESQFAVSSVSIAFFFFSRSHMQTARHTQSTSLVRPVGACRIRARCKPSRCD